MNFILGDAIFYTKLISGYISFGKFTLAAVEIDEFIAKSVNINQDGLKIIIQDFSESLYSQKQVVIDKLEQYKKSFKVSVESTIKENTTFFNRISNDITTSYKSKTNDTSKPQEYRKGFVNQNKGVKENNTTENKTIENKENQKSIRIFEESKHNGSNNELIKSENIINKFNSNNMSFGKKFSSSSKRVVGGTSNENSLKSQINLKYL